MTALEREAAPLAQSSYLRMIARPCQDAHGYWLTSMATPEGKLGGAHRGALFTVASDGIAYNCYFANPSQGKNQIVIPANLAIAHSDALNNRF